MPNHKTKPTGNGRPERHREVVIDDSVSLFLSTLGADERAVIDSVIRSPERLEELVPTAHRGGTNGQLYIADASPRVKVIYRLTPTTAEVVGLLSKRAFDQLLELQAAEG